jgi:MFS family permease
MFVTICIIGAFAILSSTMSKNPVLNPFAESLGTPVTFMGIVAAASTLPGVLISFPVGSLSDVLGRRKVLLVSSVVFASAPFFYVLVTTWWHLVLVRFYHGFATAIFVPVARATIAEYSTARKGERIATFTAATIVGRGIAPFLGGFILSVTVWNYRLLYLAVGLAGATAFGITLVFFRTRNAVMDSSSPTTLDRASTPQPQEPVGDWRTVLKHGGILVASATEASARYVHGALEFFFIGYLNNVAELDPSLIGIIMGVQFVLIPILSPFLGRVSDRIGRTTPILIGLLLSGIPILVIPSVTGFLPLFVISLLYGVGFVTVISSTPALVTDLTQRGTYGAAMGFLATVMDIGQMLGPIITGLVLASAGYTGSFWSLGVILLSIALVFSGYNKLRERSRSDEIAS